MRVRFRSRSSWWLGAALTLALLAGIATFASGGRRVPVVVAARDLGPGEAPGAPGAVRTVLVPEGARLPGMFADAAALGDRRASAPIAPGEPITDAALGGRPGVVAGPLRPGERAVSVPGTAAGAALPVLVAGALVDVVASGDGGARVVVDGAEVIAQVPAASDGGEDAALLLRVSAEGALRLTAALDLAPGVRIVPRPFDDGPGGGG